MCFDELWVKLSCCDLCLSEVELVWPGDYGKTHCFYKELQYGRKTKGLKREGMAASRYGGGEGLL